MSTRERAYRIFQTLTEKQLEEFILMFQGETEEELPDWELEFERELDKLRSDPVENAKLPFSLRKLTREELDEELSKSMEKSLKDIEEGRGIPFEEAFEQIRKAVKILPE